MNVSSVSDYFMSSGSSKSAKEISKKGAPRQGTLAVESGENSGKTCLASQKIHSGLAGLVVGATKEQQEAFIRKELLKLRSRGTAAMAEAKHFYTIPSQTKLSTTESTVAVSRIVNGFAISQRLTNTVKLRFLKLRMFFQRVPTGAGTVAAQSPIITIVVWRDKIPATPGTAPTIYGVDANPPASNSLMFSQLGGNALFNSIAVLNTITVLDYHIYKVEHFDFNDIATYDYTTPATAYGIPAPRKVSKDIYIDLHDVMQTYATVNSTAADINDIYVTFLTDLDYTNQGYADYYAMTSDLTFEDVQGVE